MQKFSKKYTTLFGALRGKVLECESGNSKFWKDGDGGNYDPAYKGWFYLEENGVMAIG